MTESRCRGRFTRLPSVPELPALEQEILEFWQRERVFDRLREQNAGGPRFGFFDGTVTTNKTMGVGAGAVLEYPPDPIVPFRGLRLFARVCVTVERDSTVILGEALLPGRAAHHEARVYNLYWAETEVRDADGGVLFADVLRLNRSRATIQDRSVCSGRVT